ncbi:hypothetical protein CON39_11720 [Bacillus thuringiensis]|uniref:hypothetical protein n=1 Tax=Bacillus thuringiensis TaxID=1428 RepID=UPI000BECBFF4|nr:hypothetical protein [Bacillus thuringiensis]PEF30334.1 hypothetical protein CON39_11720 [Bacillus thuringiensis]
MSVDRLKRVKEEAYHTKNNALGYETTLIKKTHFDYLMEQAEKVAELESKVDNLNKTIKDSDNASRLEELEGSNKYLRNALKRAKGRSSLVGKEIKDFYCNGYFGRRYDLEGSIIMEVGSDHITVRTKEGSFATAHFDGDWCEVIDDTIERWLKGEDDDSY